MSLYLAVELCSLAIPLAFSFDRKVAYYRMWPFVLPAILVNSIIFIAIDIWFTSNGVWGFNSEYHSGLIILGLPLEELLFFIIIPYCSMFVHYVFISYLPGTAPGPKVTAALSGLLFILLILYSFFAKDLSYTFFYTVLTAGMILLAYLTFPSMLARYYVTFTIIMIPFVIVNGILTGGFSGTEVFWYNNEEISGIRLISIPVEDIFFGFSLILSNLVAAEALKKLMKR